MELQFLAHLVPTVPAGWMIVVVTDRGLWSPTLWRRIRSLGWPPLMRVRRETTFAPAGGMRQAARHFVSGPGQAWVGTGTAFEHHAKRISGTLRVVWLDDQDAPWILRTDLVRVARLDRVWLPRAQTPRLALAKHPAH